MATPGSAASADGAPGDVRALRPPPPWRLLCEGRAVGELASLWAVQSFLDLPRGDGHPVLVFPGFIASGVSTRPLRRFLTAKGYAAHCWDQGRNLGLQADLENRMQARVQEMRRRYGRKVSLVGWSLGGVFAREVARAVPDDVRLVITLGSPFAAPKANHSWRLYNLLADTRIEDLDPARFERMREPPPVPSTAIYTESDGITAWQSCLERPGPRSESIAVTASHCGLGFNPLVYTAIADRLAQPEGRWRPFRRSGLRRHFFRRPRYHAAGF